MARCRKIRYRDEVAALLALESTGRRAHKREKEEKRAYRCPRCKGWHLTAQSKRRVR
jgi:hypothetical protein